MHATRDRQRPIKVYATPDERAEIEARARAVSMTTSNYLRTLGLGYLPKSTLDQQNVGALGAVNAHQGRLGGLLKLWISSRPGEGASVLEVRKLLRQIEETQIQIKALVIGLWPHGAGRRSIVHR